MQQRREAIERQTAAFVKSGGAHDRAVVTIPVVVHVVWHTAVENVSLAQIQSQLVVLNDDFRKLNADIVNVPAPFQPLAADCEINFCLAQQDPSGNLTTGVERRKTSIAQFIYPTQDMKHYATGGLNAWDATKYLNIWVINLGGGPDGFGSFPGGNLSEDGIVMLYQHFGTVGAATPPYTFGRVSVHEIGHWLNLIHVWGDDGGACDGSDLVDDTPNQGDHNFDCGPFPIISCNNGPNGDLYVDYMDYAPDDCVVMFTYGQKDRMQANFSAGGAREGIVSSLGCTAGVNNGTCGIPAALNASSITFTSATLNWGAVANATKYTVQRKASASGTWTTVNNVLGLSYSISGLSPATSYDYRVQAHCGTLNGVFSSTATFTTVMPACPDQFEPNPTKSTAATTMPLNAPFTAQIATATDNDFYKFANTTAAKNIKIDLTSLPADYDLRLYRGSTLLATSANTGTADESVTFNTTVVSTQYFANVTGYNGAFNGNFCYTLKISLSATAWHTDGSTDGPIEQLELPVVFENEGFGIFPNPATNAVTLEIPMRAEADVQITVLDPNGRTVVQTTEMLGKTNNRVNLDLAKLATGMYFVQVRNGGEIKTRKLVVNK